MDTESLGMVDELEELEERHEIMGAAFARQMAAREAEGDVYFRMNATDSATIPPGASR